MILRKKVWDLHFPNWKHANNPGLFWWSQVTLRNDEIHLELRPSWQAQFLRNNLMNCRNFGTKSKTWNQWHLSINLSWFFTHFGAFCYYPQCIVLCLSYFSWLAGTGVEFRVRSMARIPRDWESWALNADTRHSWVPRVRNGCIAL